MSLPRLPVARLLIASLLIALASPGVATAALPRAAEGGGIGLRLLDMAPTAGNDPRARLYITDHLAPGTVIHRRIEVSNTTVSATTVGLYAAAASIANGSFLGAGGTTANELSTWTSVVPASTRIPAGGKLTATVTIAVPRDAPPGEQYGVVWAEARTAPSTPGGVTQVNRVGIRLYLSVGPGGAPAANFRIDALTARRSPTGVPSIVAQVRNTGGRALDMAGTLSLKAGPGGLSAGPFPASLGVTLAIGKTEPVTIALDDQLPAGPWDAKITMRSGLVERSAQATVTFPKSGSGPAVRTSSVQPAWLYPGIGLAVVLLLGAAAALYRRPRLYRRPVLGRAGPATSAPRHGAG